MSQLALTVNRSESQSEQDSGTLNYQLIMDSLIKRFEQIVPSFSNQFADFEAVQLFKREWCYAFHEAGLKLHQIENGVRKLRQSASDFMPSCGKFISWCKDIDFSEFNLPDVDTLKKRFHRYCSYSGEANLFTFESDIEYHILTETYAESYRLRFNNSFTDKECRRFIQQSLEKWVEKLAKGEEIPPRPKLLPKTLSESKQLPDEVIAQRFAELRARLGLARPKPSSKPQSSNPV